MTPAPISRWQHDHVFGQDTTLVGERRTRIVIGITAATMAVEIAGGLAFGSMALLADGLHMGSHAIALTIAGIAYAYTRRRARDTRFSFGTGKVNSLAGYTGALLLAFFSFLMAAESTRRFFQPVEIRFDHAILVAFVGLLVNVASIVILGGHHPYEEEIERPDGSLEPPGPPAEVGTVEGPGVGTPSPGKPGGDPSAHDHNLRSAYLHVLADALTSVLAILSLLAGRFLGLSWMDPAMGIVGAILVAHWALGLARLTARVLLDRQAHEPILRAVKESIESREGNRVADLHVWCIGPGIHAAVISVVADRPLSPEEYRNRLPTGLGLVHVTVEVHDAAREPGGIPAAGNAAPPPVAS